MMKRCLMGLILSGCFVLPLPALFAEEPTAEPQSQETVPQQEETTRKQSALTISQETTYLVEPLKKNGYVDYNKALNQITSEGVTPENNASVVLWQVLGPKEVPEQIRKQHFEMLGMEPLPLEGEYYQDYWHYLNQKFDDQETVQDLLEKSAEAQNRPWSAEEFPHLAEWLKANEAPLNLAVEAVKRPKMYEPLVGTYEGEDEAGTMIAILLPGAQLHRDVGRALLTRALHSVHRGDEEAAMRDLLATHRLARLTGTGPTLINALVGIAVDAIATQGDLALAHSGLLSREQLQNYRKELAQLPPLPDMAAKIDIAERFMFLDTLEHLSRGDQQFMEDIGGFEGFEKVIGSWIAKKSVDWDLIAKLGNSWYDRLRDAAMKPTLEEREKALAEIESELKAMVSRNQDPVKMLKKMAFSLSPRKTISEGIGNIMISLLLPAVTQVVFAEERAETYTEIVEVALLLAEYRAVHGEYPEKLEQLTPDFTKELPVDRFSGKPFHYSRTENGFQIYSVGRNHKDDGGTSYDADPPGDDLVFELPYQAK